MELVRSLWSRFFCTTRATERHKAYRYRKNFSSVHRNIFAFSFRLMSAIFYVSDRLIKKFLTLWRVMFTFYTFILERILNLKRFHLLIREWKGSEQYVINNNDFENILQWNLITFYIFQRFYIINKNFLYSCMHIHTYNITKRILWNIISYLFHFSQFSDIPINLIGIIHSN